MALFTGTHPPPIPADTPLVGKDRIMDWFWVQWFVERDALIQASARTVVDATLVTQAASIGSTALEIGTAGAFYRLNVYSRITQAATVSSSLALAFQWTEGGVGMTQTLPAMTANTVTTYTASTFPFRIDPNTAVTYSTTYASSGVTPMQYSLEIAVERLA